MLVGTTAEMEGRNTEKLELLSVSASSPSSSVTRSDSSDSGTKPPEPSCRRLSVPIAVVMIIGKVVGGALIWLPHALYQMGWTGFVTMVVSAAVSMFTGILLARSWMTLTRWFPDKYRYEINRFPYPSIGYETFGNTGRRITSIVIAIYSFGFTIAMYLVVADNVRLFFHIIGIRVAMCVAIPIVCCVAAPLLWFGTPKDMVAVGIVSASTSITVAICITIGSLLDIGVYIPDDEPTVRTVWSVAQSFGVILTAFGGQFVIPSIQHDMAKPENMQGATAIAYVCILIIYLIIGAATFVVYGNTGTWGSLQSGNIIALITTTPVKIAVIVFASLHMLVAAVFLMNPMFQDIEDSINIRYELNWKRVLLRASCSVLVMLIALALPSFSLYLSLFGGIVVSVVNGILPVVLYCKLCTMQGPPGSEPEGPLRWYHILVIGVVCLLSVTAALTASVGGAYQLLAHNYTSSISCYAHFS